MDDVQLVKEVYRAEQVVYYGFDVGVAKARGLEFAQHLEKIKAGTWCFHDDEQVLEGKGVVLILDWWQDNVKKFWCEDVVLALGELTKNFDFAESVFSSVNFGEDILDELDGALPAGLLADSLYHEAVGSLTKFLL